MIRCAKFFTTSIHQSYFVVAMCVGIISGAILALIFRINYFVSPLWILLAVSLLIVAYLKPKLAFLIIVLLAGNILIFFRVTDELKGEDYIRTLYNQNIVVTGTITGDVTTDETATKFKLSNLKFGQDADHASSGNIYITMPINKSTNEQIYRSDQVTLEGKLSNGFGTYAGFMYRPRILKINHPTPGDPILKIRNWFADRIGNHIEDPASKLGLSYLLGMKTGIPDDLSENLRTVGLVHIVVASGAHLSILVEIARKLFGKISRFASLIFSILFIFFFMSMVGFTPSIMRAGIMSILTLIAWYVGRKLAPWRIIIMVAAFTLILNPMFIIDLGWLLSFASFTGIMILGPTLNNFFYGDKKPGFIASIILTTISATLMTLPISMYYFGTFSLISLFANLLILPTLPIAMGFTFLTGIFADIPILSDIISFCTTQILNLHIAIVNLFASAKQFVISIDSYQWQVFLMYIVVAIIIFYTIAKNSIHPQRHLPSG